MTLWHVGSAIFDNLWKNAPFLAGPQRDEAQRMVLLANLPEVYHVGMEKYLRGFDDVPPDYKQMEAEEVKLVNEDDIIASIDPDIYYHRRHAVIVGTAGCGKSTILEKIIDKLNKQLIRFMVFPIDLQNYTGDEVLNATDFLFHRRGNADLSVFGGSFGSMAARSERLVFLLNGLDQMPADFEADCEKITEGTTAPTRVIIHNLLIGKIYRNSKIISTCRHYRVRNLRGKLAPDEIFNVGELNEKSEKDLADVIFGQATSKQVLDIYKQQSPSLCVLNGTAPYLLYSLLSTGNGESFRYERTVPMILLDLLVAIIRSEDPLNRHTVAIIQKMKELAYFGIKGHKYSFDEKFVRTQFNLTPKEIEAVSCTVQAHYRAKYHPMTISGSTVAFVDLHMQELMCAMKITDMAIEEYKGFLKNDIHKPNYYTLRRMVCSFILDPNVQRPAIREKLIKESDDMKLRKSLLISSMRSEFHKVKRRELLAFMHAVRDCGEGGLEILPRKIDTIDLSHIQLFLLDTHAIGASISGNLRIDCLNLSNCNMSINGISVLRSKLLKTKTRIRSLILDFCGDWTQNLIGIESYCDIIKACEIRELSLNNVIFYASGLQMMTVGLGHLKVKTLRLQNVTGLTDQAYALLGDFIIRHDVEDLYITAKDLTEKQKRKLSSGLREFKIKEKMPLASSTMYLGRLDVDSD